MIIKFNKNIYKEKAIKKAISDYGQIASIGLEKKDEYYIVKISETPAEIKSKICDEFANYIIQLMHS